MTDARDVRSTLGINVRGRSQSAGQHAGMVCEQEPKHVMTTILYQATDAHQHASSNLILHVISLRSLACAMSAEIQFENSLRNAMMVHEGMERGALRIAWLSYLAGLAREGTTPKMIFAKNCLMPLRMKQTRQPQKLMITIAETGNLKTQRFVMIHCKTMRDAHKTALGFWKDMIAFRLRKTSQLLVVRSIIHSLPLFPALFNN